MFVQARACSVAAGFDCSAVARNWAIRRSRDGPVARCNTATTNPSTKQPAHNTPDPRYEMTSPPMIGERNAEPAITKELTL